MAVLGKPNINGVAYAHSDIIVNILGVPVVGVTEITYSDPQDMELNYGAGNQPISVGFGKINPTGSVTMEMHEVEKLTDVAPAGKLQNIPFFDIGVNFRTEDGKVARHRLIQCRFKGRDTSSAVDNTQLTETLELLVGGVEYKA
jgi:hypothetical protein